MSIFEKAKNAIKSGTDELATGISKFKNKSFMEGTVAVCAIISMASGGACAEEKQKMIGFIKQSKDLAAFDVNEIIAFFNKLTESFDFDRDIGKGQAMEYVMKLKSKPEAAQLAVRVGIAVGKSDGDFDPQEKDAVRDICVALGLSAADFQL